jgi:hypothetical protein
MALRDQFGYQNISVAIDSKADIAELADGFISGASNPKKKTSYGLRIAQS